MVTHVLFFIFNILILACIYFIFKKQQKLVADYREDYRDNLRDLEDKYISLTKKESTLSYQASKYILKIQEIEENIAKIDRTIEKLEEMKKPVPRAKSVKK